MSELNKTEKEPCSGLSGLTVKLESRIEELENALRWYVENDDVYEGGEWDSKNEYWIEGKRRAEKLLSNVKLSGSPASGESELNAGLERKLSTE